MNPFFHASIVHCGIRIGLLIVLAMGGGTGSIKAVVHELDNDAYLGIVLTKFRVAALEEKIYPWKER